MANKDALLQVKITQKQKKQIETAAKAQDVKVAEYVLTALDFYGSFDMHFLRHMRDTADKLHINFGVFIQQMLTAYTASDAAKLAVHGEGHINSYAYALQFDEHGLIQGRKHFDLVFEQAKKDEALWKKLKVSDEKAN